MPKKKGKRGIKDEAKFAAELAVAALAGGMGQAKTPEQVVDYCAAVVDALVAKYADADAD